MTANTSPKIRRLPNLLLIVFCVWINLPTYSWAQNQNLTSFEEFIAQFPTEQQIQALSIWNEIQITESPALEPATQDITDDQLFTALKDENKTPCGAGVNIKEDPQDKPGG